MYVRQLRDHGSSSTRPPTMLPVIIPLRSPASATVFSCHAPRTRCRNDRTSPSPVYDRSIPGQTPIVSYESVLQSLTRPGRCDLWMILGWMIEKIE
ncbi:hypothetical protein WH47_04577 [Habropoda laboriosa]|uniref:Uncharacterized protein n=1 Tax=Habropoda laboriosa TaxID=597456 RepID=A0A0L7R283_9HYME|nr:hypothetical protein WH47_04577 [Habropoda laboriosa]